MIERKTGTSTQNVSILGGETRMASGPMEKGWQTARKAGVLEERGFWRLSSDEFGWSRTDDWMSPHE